MAVVRKMFVINDIVLFITALHVITFNYLIVYSYLTLQLRTQFSLLAAIFSYLSTVTIYMQYVNIGC